MFPFVCVVQWVNALIYKTVFKRGNRLRVGHFLYRDSFLLRRYVCFPWRYFLHSDALDYANTTKKPFVRNVLTGLPSPFALFFTPTFVRDIFLPCKT